jgi:hypothetical protein
MQFLIHDGIAGDENFRCMQYCIIEWIHVMVCKNISEYKTSYAHLHMDVFLSMAVF